MSLTSEYAFQLSLSAIARIDAESEEEARTNLNKIEMIDASDLQIPNLHGRITEVSIAHNLDKAELLEIDGDKPCRECGGANPDGGDGWDGLCPECADRASAILDVEDDGWVFVKTSTGWYGSRGTNRTHVLPEKIDVARFIDDARDVLELPSQSKPNVVVLYHSRRALFVLDCLWHGHGCGDCEEIPETWSDYWLAKITRNRARDASNIRELKQQGWRTLVLWECGLKDEARLRRRLTAFLGKSGTLPQDSGLPST